MRKKGFTLIELLAVIVILAIIALIAVPVIADLIEETKVGAFKDSVSIALRSSDLYAITSGEELEDGIDITVIPLNRSEFNSGLVRLNNNKLEAVNISDGNYCANGNLGTLTIYKGDCDTEIPLSPTITLVEDELVTTNYSASPAYIITASSEIISGIHHFEYYLSDIADPIDENQTPTGTNETGEFVINTESNYVNFRIVNNAGKKGYWGSFINYTDLSVPTVTSSVIEDTANLTLADAKSGVVSYCVTSVNDSSACDWIDVEKSNNIDVEYTLTEEGTYYAFSKDVLGNVSLSNSFTILANAFCAFNAGDEVETFGLEGSVEEFTVPCDGNYKLEVYGAQGGSYINTGGLGGYSSGNITLASGDLLYVAVGGKGTSAKTYRDGVSAGGYNGGGNGRTDGAYDKTWYGSAGGGATHIAKVDGTLSEIGSESISNGNLIIVAGAGGGALYSNSGNAGAGVLPAYNWNGGYGGGLTGQTVTNINTASGATQTSGGTGNSGGDGSFGSGGVAGNAGSGGGAGLYGGEGSNYYTSGAGGSGYLSSLLIDGTTSIDSNINSGDGSAKITYLGK